MRLLFFALLLTAASPALAQEDIPAPVKFGEAEITFARGEDEEITVSYNGVELYRNFYVSFDRIVTLAGEEVALLSGGDGGNACGPNSLIVTLPVDSPDAKLEVIGACGSPAPAVTIDEIYYVPYLEAGRDRAGQELVAVTRTGRRRQACLHTENGHQLGEFGSEDGERSLGPVRQCRYLCCRTGTARGQI